MKIFIKTLLISAILLLAITILMLIHWGYHNTLFYFARYAKTPYRIDLLEKIITKTTYISIIAITGITLAILLTLLTKFERIYLPIAIITVEARASLVARWEKVRTGHVLFLTLIPISASVYYTFKMPISIDEAYMYDYFSSRGFLSSISYYPAPNNHVLHTLLTNFFLILPLSDTVCLRIPSILASVLCLFFLYSLVDEYYNKYIAYTSIAIYSTFSMTVYYSFMSRGYALQCLFFILMTYSILKVISKPQKKIYWLYFCLSGIGGLYTMPCFLYPLIIGNLFLLIKLKRVAIHHLLSIAGITVATCMLYLPIIVVNDIHALANSYPMASIPRDEVLKRILPFFYESYQNITGLPFILIFSILCIGMSVHFVKYRIALGEFFFLVLMLSPLLLIVQSVIPFSRTFEYYACIFSLFIAIVIYAILKKYTSTGYYFAGLIVIQIILLTNSNRQIMRNEMYSIITHDVLPRIDSGRTFNVYASAFDLYLMFHLRERNIYDYSINSITNDSFSINMDTIAEGNRDYTIVENHANKTIHRKPIIKTDFYSIYK